jgi:Zn-finger nucleic acid-binding protein
MKCPRCKVIEAARVVRHSAANPALPIEIDICPHCQGTWFDPGELSKLIPNLKTLDKPDLSPLSRTLDCPRCATNLATIPCSHANIDIEWCPHCDGVWLDAGEFEELKTNVANGSVQIPELPPLNEDFMSIPIESEDTNTLQPSPKAQVQAHQSPEYEFTSFDKLLLSALAPIVAAFRSIADVLPDAPEGGRDRTIVTCPSCNGTGKMSGMLGPRDCLFCMGDLRVCSLCHQSPRFCTCASERQEYGNSW